MCTFVMQYLVPNSFLIIVFCFLQISNGPEIDKPKSYNYEKLKTINHDELYKFMPSKRIRESPKILIDYLSLILSLSLFDHYVNGLFVTDLELSNGTIGIDH